MSTEQERAPSGASGSWGEPEKKPVRKKKKKVARKKKINVVPELAAELDNVGNQFSEAGEDTIAGYEDAYATKRAGIKGYSGLDFSKDPFKDIDALVQERDVASGAIIDPSKKYESEGPMSDISMMLMAALTPRLATSYFDTVDKRKKGDMATAAARAKSSGKGMINMGSKHAAELTDDATDLENLRAGTVSLESYMEDLIAEQLAASKAGRKNAYLTSKNNSLFEKIKNAYDTAKRAFLQKFGQTLGTRDPVLAKAQSAYFTILNAYIRSVTGAQMSEHEAKRIMAAFPSLRENPVAFMGLWHNMVQQREKKFLNTYHGLLKAGYKGTQVMDLTYSRIKANPFRPNPKFVEAWQEVVKNYKPEKKKKKGSGQSTGTRPRGTPLSSERMKGLDLD